MRSLSDQKKTKLHRKLDLSVQLSLLILGWFSFNYIYLHINLLRGHSDTNDHSGDVYQFIMERLISKVASASPVA